MESPGQRLVGKFIRSKFLPLATIVVLLVAWLSISIAILWQAKVREEFVMQGHLLAREKISTAQGRGEGILFQGSCQQKPLFLPLHEEVAMRFSTDSGEGQDFKAEVLFIEKTGDGCLLMAAAARLPPETADWLSRNSARETNGVLQLTFRSRRLLQIALKKKRAGRGLGWSMND